MEYSKVLEQLKANGFSEADTKQGGLSFAGSLRDLKAAAPEIHEDEKVLAVAGGEYIYLGMRGAKVNNAVFILTEERLIRADKKISNVDIESFYIDEINSVSNKASFLSSTLMINVPGHRIKVAKVKKATAKKFSDILNKMVRDEKKAVRAARRK